jgi:hypothetical protein
VVQIHSPRPLILTAILLTTTAPQSSTCVCTKFATSADMRTVTLPLPVFGFVLGTRAALAAGLALLLADKFAPEQRRRVGATLVTIGALTTVPAARWISRSFRGRRSMTGVQSDSRLLGAHRYPRKGDDAL